MSKSPSKPQTSFLREVPTSLPLADFLLGTQMLPEYVPVGQTISLSPKYLQCGLIIKTYCDVPQHMGRGRGGAGQREGKSL